MLASSVCVIWPCKPVLYSCDNSSVMGPPRMWGLPSRKYDRGCPSESSVHHERSSAVSGRPISRTTYDDEIAMVAVARMRGYFAESRFPTGTGQGHPPVYRISR